MRAVEDLIAMVRDPRSRAHFTEAVRAYNAGAYRSAIISTWVTVAFDLIGKIRQLGDDGEAAAVQHITGLDTAIANSDRKALQRIENSLLEDARDKFELIDTRDYETLMRLYVDRNVCAHPAFVAPEVAFEASPELVRAHLATAVDAVLRHGATAGRKALDRFIEEVQGLTWPGSHDALVAYVRDRFLDRGRQGLQTNLAKLVVKGALGIGEPIGEPARHRLAATAHAIDEINPDLLSKALVGVVRPAEEGAKGLAPHQLMYLVGSLGDLSSAWEAFPPSSVPRITTLIKAADYAALTRTGVLSAVVKQGDISAAIKERLAELSPEELYDVVVFRPTPHHVEHALAALAKAFSFRDAESMWQRLVLPVAPYLEAQHLNQVLTILEANYQVNKASGTPVALGELFDATASRPGALAEWQRIGEFLLTNGMDPEDPDDYFTAPTLRAKIAASAAPV